MASRSGSNSRTMSTSWCELRTSDFIRHNVGDIQTIAEAQTAKVSYVSDARAFFDALENGATICITPNTVINLSEVLNDPTYFSDITSSIAVLVWVLDSR